MPDIPESPPLNRFNTGLPDLPDFQMNPSEPKWASGNTSEPKWTKMNQSEAKWTKVKQSEAKWAKVKKSKPRWIKRTKVNKSDPS